MTQEHKELLLRDLCARLPYNVIVDYSYNAHDLRKGNYVKHVKHGSKCILTCDLLDVLCLHDKMKKENTLSLISAQCQV